MKEIKESELGVVKDPKDFCKVVGKRLFELRTKHNISQNNIAKACKLTQNILSRMENGFAKYDNFLVVCNYWVLKGYNLNYLLAEDNSPYHEIIPIDDLKQDISIYFDQPD